MANPEHMEMQQNIENYRTMAGVESHQLVDREAKPHLVSSWDPVFYDMGPRAPEFPLTRTYSCGRVSQVDSPSRVTFLYFHISQMKFVVIRLKNNEKMFSILN